MIELPVWWTVLALRWSFSFKILLRVHGMGLTSSLFHSIVGISLVMWGFQFQGQVKSIIQCVWWRTRAPPRSVCSALQTGGGLERKLTETHKNVRVGFSFNRQCDVNGLANSSDLLWKTAIWTFFGFCEYAFRSRHEHSKRVLSMTHNIS